MMKRAMSTANVKRPEEYHGGSRGAVSSLGDAHDPASMPEPEDTALERRSSRHPKRNQTENHRDILVLFREQKEITKKDLISKENRQILHYLMYENKLNLSLQELAKTVRKETKDGVVPKPPKPELYVEAT